MDADPIVTCRVEDGVALIRMQDEAGRNALSRRMTEELERVFAGIQQNEEVKAAVLAGVPDYFCTGASRDVLLEIAAGGIAPRDLLLPRVLLDLNVPLIAAMEGHAIGGGLALALCSDLIVAARESRYGCNFMEYGFTPGMGTSQLLEHVLGPGLASEMLFTGRTFRGVHFERYAGFNYVLPRMQVLPKAMDLAARIAEKPKPALAALKISLSARKREIFEHARTAEILMHQLTFAQAGICSLIEERYPG